MLSSASKKDKSITSLFNSSRREIELDLKGVQKIRELSAKKSSRSQRLKPFDPSANISSLTASVISKQFDLENMIPDSFASPNKGAEIEEEEEKVEYKEATPERNEGE